jgi:hypothetical protein
LKVLLSPAATVLAGRLSIVPAAVFETSAVTTNVDEAAAAVGAGVVAIPVELVSPPHADNNNAPALAARSGKYKRIFMVHLLDLRMRGLRLLCCVSARR